MHVCMEKPILERAISRREFMKRGRAKANGAEDIFIAKFARGLARLPVESANDPSHFPHCGKIIVSRAISGPAGPFRFCLQRKSTPTSPGSWTNGALSPNTEKSHRHSAASCAFDTAAVNNSRRKRRRIVGPDINFARNAHQVPDSRAMPIAKRATVCL